ncbi:hypothetical protein [Chenggangzhangella methanolivorans]|uniref:hypothetical protein n=1 Tax=Chenggangzhangella methanolivorans TaxID=1437009 RepID=UPI0021BDCFAD|nr:hypothetical protein [Chenggangzhangella methanolivorans]
MSRAPSFRASTALIVTGFAVIAGVIAFGLGHDLWRPIPGMAPQVSWLMPETTPVRLAALKGAGMPETAALYASSSRCAGGSSARWSPAVSPGAS